MSFCETCRALSHCAATHPALEAAAERKGEERVRRILGIRRVTDADGTHIHTRGSDLIRPGLTRRSLTDAEWWALTGEGEPPKEPADAD